MNVLLFSFGFKHAPPEAESVFDVRFLPNPYYVSELSSGTGLNPDVAGYVLHNSIAENFFRLFEPFIVTYIQGHANAGKTQFRLAFGCTGGRHRSVAVAERVRTLLREQGIAAETFHRDIDKE